MKTLLLTLLLFPLIATAQKANFISAGIVGATSVGIIYGAKQYSERPPQRGQFKNDYAYYVAQRQHLRTYRSLYAIGAVTTAFTIAQITLGTVKLVKRKNALLQLNANSVYLTLKF